MFEAPFLRRIVRCPRTTGGVCLQESRDLFLGKIDSLHVEIRFRNTSTIAKDHQVEISILVVKDAYCFIITQASLHYCAIRIFNLVAAVAQIRPDAGQGCECRENDGAELLHTVSVGQFTEICNRAHAILNQKRRIVLVFPATT